MYATKNSLTLSSRLSDDFFCTICGWNRALFVTCSTTHLYFFCSVYMHEVSTCMKVVQLQEYSGIKRVCTPRSFWPLSRRCHGVGADTSSPATVPGHVEFERRRRTCLQTRLLCCCIVSPLHLLLFTDFVLHPGSGKCRLSTLSSFFAALTNGRPIIST